MTYLQFLLVFIVPPIVVLSLVQPRPWAGVGARATLRAIGLIAAIAFVYTTPWDNYLVYRGVWGYEESDRVMGTVGYVPVEEYAFFVLQTLLTGLWYALVRSRLDRRVASPLPDGRGQRRVRAAGAAVYGALALAGAAMLAGERSLYMGLILAWACPVLAGMWWIGGHLITARRAEFALGVAVPTLYLWAADRFAIADGIWSISDRTSFGWDPLGLPIEEATFFLITNLLIVQGVLLLLAGVLDRAREGARTAAPARA